VTAELFHTGGRTDMTKLIVAFRNFENAPKNYKICITNSNTRKKWPTLTRVGKETKFPAKMILNVDTNIATTAGLTELNT